MTSRQTAVPPDLWLALRRLSDGLDPRLADHRALRREIRSAEKALQAGERPRLSPELRGALAQVGEQ